MQAKHRIPYSGTPFKSAALNQILKYWGYTHHNFNHRDATESNEFATSDGGCVEIFIRRDFHTNNADFEIFFDG